MRRQTLLNGYSVISARARIISKAKAFLAAACLLYEGVASYAAAAEDNVPLRQHGQNIAGLAPERSRPRLSDSAYEVASDLGLLPAFDNLEKAQGRDGRESFSSFKLRQQLLETVILASFEIRSALSRIDRDLSQTNELRSLLDEKRERNVQKSDIVNFLQSGATEVLSTSLADFSGRQGPLSVAGAIFGVLGGSGEVGISSYSLKLNHGPKRSSPANPNMLSQIFGYTNESSRFPSGVWNYLNDPRPRSPDGETRRAFLIKQWLKLKRISNPATGAGHHRIALLTGQIPQFKTVDIDLLLDRSMMLSDLRAAVSQMDQEMLEIMRWVKNL